MTNTWTGKDAGVRKPMAGETPLSAAEVWIGVRNGAFTVDDAPTTTKAKPKKKRKSRATTGTRTKTVPWGQALLDTLRHITEAGDDGILSAKLKDQLPAWKRQTISTALLRHIAAGRVQRRGAGSQTKYWLATVPAKLVDAGWAAVLAESEERRKIREQRRVEKAKQQYAEARAAIRQEQMEKRRLEADLKAQEAREVEQAAKAKAGKKISRETAAINRIADKYRGTTAPSIVPMPQARPKAAPVEIPPHLVTVCRPMTLPHERIVATGEISKEIGRYSVEASTWAKAVAA